MESLDLDYEQVQLDLISKNNVITATHINSFSSEVVRWTPWLHTSMADTALNHGNQNTQNMRINRAYGSEHAQRVCVGW